MAIRPRIVTGQLSHETNTFSVIPADLQAFREREYSKGKEVLDNHRGTSDPLGGIIDAAEEFGFELLPTIAANAHPSGPVTAEAFEEFASLILAGIREAQAGGRLDGVLLALHGAMVVETFADGEGELLSRIRAEVGPSVPIVSSLDFHANMTHEMVANADVLVGYNTYPHIDTYERGFEAGKFLAQILDGELRPVSVLKKPRLLPTVVAQRTAVGVFRKLFDCAYEIEDEPGVVEVCCYGGFPYADIEPAGVGILVVTNDDPELAEEMASRLEQLAYELKDEMVADVLPPGEAIDKALDTKGRPAVLVDVADNPGAGGSCDSTGILAALVDRKVSDAALFLADREVVAAAFEAGVGAEIDVMLGGKRDTFHGEPVPVTAYVKTLSDGDFVHKGPQFTGVAGHLGRTAVLVIDGLKVVVSEYRVQTLDPEVFRAVGVEPTDNKIVVVKSSVHYRAAFEPIAAEIIEVAAPGIANPDLSAYDFKNLRRPMFPLDSLDG